MTWHQNKWFSPVLKRFMDAVREIIGGEKTRKLQTPPLVMPQNGINLN
jgi:hypothetical protein